MKTNIKRYMVIFTSFILLLFTINVLSDYNNVYADTSSSHGGGGSFGSESDSNQTTNQTTTPQKTGKNVNDVKNLGENTLENEAVDGDNVLGHLAVNGGTGTEGGLNTKDRYTKFNTALYKIWGVILVVLQVASMSGIIFAGVRYMFASVDSKADMKKSMIYLVIGMIIVFAASSVVGFVTGTFDEIFSSLIF